MAGKRPRDSRNRNNARGRGWKGGRGSGGQSGYPSQQRRQQQQHQHPPRRGPPAIFVTCESGRERKCQREALELIHHYYYKSHLGVVGEEENDGDRENDAQTQTRNQQHRRLPQEEEPLSLEEELAMLRKGAAAEEVLSYERGQKRAKTADNESQSNKIDDDYNDTKANEDKRNDDTTKINDGDAPHERKTISSMKSPFSVYDTGIRGMVCLVCTLPGCELVPYDDILSEKKKESQNAMKEKGQEREGIDEKGLVQIRQKGGDKFGQNEIDVAKHIDAVSFAAIGSGSNNYSTIPFWDPVQTVKEIMDGVIYQSQTGNVTEKSTHQQQMDPPPGFRFISRMIPMQATCFASIDEIKLVTKSLLQRYLPSIKQSLLVNGNITPEKAITFKIDFKRRNCSHLSTMKVVEVITPMLLSDVDDKQTRGDGSDHNEKNGNTACTDEKDPSNDEIIDKNQKYAVNLTDPDFAIRIEVCRTFCGISVLPREVWYKNFNLAELLGGANDDGGDGSAS